jgi:hypothetical protein
MSIEPLIEQYLASAYCYREGGRETSLRVGIRSDEVMKLHARRGVESSAYITAWNPGSKPLDRDENRARNRELRREAESAGLEVLEGEGRSPGRDWCEESFLILGIGREQALGLAHKYGQVAFLQIGSAGVPELVICEREMREGSGRHTR